MKRNMMYVVGAVVAGLLAWTQYMIFFGTPLETRMLFNQKIFYYHVPQSFVLFLAVIVCGVYSVLYLKKRDGKYDDVAAAAGTLSVFYGAMVLVTGMIWGRAEWGHWWRWDARLTTSLLLWMVMVGYVLVRKYGGPSSSRLAAGLAVFGMADVPLIYFSVKIWRTVHPKTTVVTSLDASMRGTFWASVLCFLLLYGMLMALLVREARNHRMLHEAREHGLDVGILV